MYIPQCDKIRCSRVLWRMSVISHNHGGKQKEMGGHQHAAAIGRRAYLSSRRGEQHSQFHKRNQVGSQLRVVASCQCKSLVPDKRSSYFFWIIIPWQTKIRNRIENKERRERCVGDRREIVWKRKWQERQRQGHKSDLNGQFIPATSSGMMTPTNMG